MSWSCTHGNAACVSVPEISPGSVQRSPTAGASPFTGERVIDAAARHHTLAVMLTAGLYESSGEWLYDLGLRGKSGIGGGIVTIFAVTGGMGTLAPALDQQGKQRERTARRKVGVLAARSGSADLPAGGTMTVSVRVDQITERDG